MKRILAAALCLLLLFGVTACNRAGPEADVPDTCIPETDAPEAGAPDDFSFSLTWNCYGISSYDSLSGKLVKTTDSTHPADYVTEYFLTEEEKEEIRALVLAMDPDAYPDEYDPMGGLASMPSRDVILTVRLAGRVKTIACRNISLGNDPKDEAAARFLALHDRIVEILTSTEVWKALPDWEFLYE